MTISGNDRFMKNRNKPDVCVMGLGYIGLPTASVIARTGCKTHGVDVNPKVVETISRGEIHIEEVDLDGLVQGVVSRGLLTASHEAKTADVFIIAVPTPFDDDKTPDISYVLEATQAISAVLKSGDIVILRSTSPVGTTEKIRDLIAKLRPDLKIPGLTNDIPDLAIAYCPERVLPGKIIEELVNNDRSIGGITPRCARKALQFYKLFVRGECITTDSRSAEMCKLVENAYRDVNIAFANELSIISDTMGLDVWEVIKLANRHPRVNILRPGAGVGGHCIAVDPWFIVHGAPDETRLVKMARHVNLDKTAHVAQMAEQIIAQYPGRKIACLGLSYKANIDDLRESPALDIAVHLAQKHGANMHIVEPYVEKLPPVFDHSGAQLIDLDDALEQCDIFIALVDHDLFRSVPLAERQHKIIYDVCGIWPDQPVLDNSSATIQPLGRALG